jgi:MSHA biogenesis protein MshP
MRLFNGKQKGFSAIIAVVLIVLFGLLGGYMATLSTVSVFNTAQSAGSMQAWFAARSGAEWAVYQALNRACTCGTDCCSTGTSGTEININGAVVSFDSGELNGYQATLSCSESAVSEGGSNYCVYNLGVNAERGSSGSITYVSRQINLSITDAP